MKKYYLLLILIALLSACGFHPQGRAILAPPLHRMYIQTTDPYGTLARNLKLDLQMSHVELVQTPLEATTILNILQDNTAQDLFSVSGTQQTRQYILRVTIVFEITDTAGRILLAPQTLSDSRTITVQSNQILGSSNEMNLFYQQMRRNLANTIIYRIASSEVTQLITTAYQSQPTTSVKKS